MPQWLIKLMAGRGSRTSCNSAEQLDRDPEELLKGDDKAICRSPKLSMSNGKLVYDTFCTNKHFPNGLLVSSHGTYTPTSYAISTISTGTKDGKPVRILTTGSGNAWRRDVRPPEPKGILIVDIEHATSAGATGATSRIVAWSVAALASTLLFVSAAHGASAMAPEPAKPVDASKLFTGQRTEIGRRPMKLTDGCVAGGTRYTPVDRTHVDVLDTCHEKTPAGKRKSIGGPGRITDPGSNTKLHVDYKLLGFLPVGRDYWILDHDEAYSWFISSNPRFTDLWIYTRTPRPNPALVKSLTDEARSMGYDVSKLEFPAQP